MSTAFYLRAALEWIDALPADVVAKLPAMPGFNRDEAETALKAAGTPAADWRERGEADPHGTHYNGERAALALGHMTDDEIANGVFLNVDQPMNIERMLKRDPNYRPPIVWLTAAKERIRWLSRALEQAKGFEKRAALYDHMLKVAKANGHDSITEAITRAGAKKPVAIVKAADEYGPMLEWSTHWVELIGKTLYTEAK